MEDINKSPLLYIHVVVNVQIEFDRVKNDIYIFDSSDLIFHDYFHPSTSDLLISSNVHHTSQLEYVSVQE